MPNRGEAGFSMIELLVAMVVTLIVSGAIFGLLTGGQNAFRREPAMTDRQQTIRVAMDLIKRDVAAAGAGMAPFVQPFTDGLNGAGVNPTSTQTSGAMGNTTLGTATDVLEVLSATGQCPSATITGASTTTQLVSTETLPRCFPDSGATAQFLYVGGTTAADVQNYGVVLGKANVAAGNSGFNLDLVNPSTANLNPVAPNPAAGFCTSCRSVMPIDVVRYAVAPDPDDQNTPALWRSRTGAFTAAGAGPFTPGSTRPNWEVVARGVDDFQVEYLNGGGAWANTPGSVYCTAPCSPPVNADLNRIVRQVRITISARAVAGGRIQGGTKAAAGSGAPDAIRGQLVAVVAPRAALTALAINPSATSRWY